MVNNTEYVDYAGFKCLQITNGKVKCLVTVDVGPRIIYYGFEENILFVDEKREIFKEGEFFDTNYKKGERWYIYGGHRLWKSEEDWYTYNCDNYPVEVQHTTSGARFSSGIQKCTNLQFELQVDMNEDGSLIVTNKITNKGSKPQNISAWGITILAADGVEILPMPDEQTGFLPNRTLTVWQYTNLDDKRLSFIGKYLKLKQVEIESNSAALGRDTALKIGIKNTAGFGFYVNKGMVYIKKTDYKADKIYPDNNSNFEAYTDSRVIEMESLCPLETIEQNQSVVHVENWNIKKTDGEFSLESESEIDEFVKKYV